MRILITGFRANARSPRASRKGRRGCVPFVAMHHLLISPTQNEPLPTSFPCLFCNHDKSVQVKLDKKGGIGELSCKVCGQHFQSGINCKLRLAITVSDLERGLKSKMSDKKAVDLSAAVDVYSDWVDACDQVAKEGGEPDEGLDSYTELAGGAGGRTNYRHVVAAAEGSTVADEYDDDM